MANSYFCKCLIIPGKIPINTTRKITKKSNLSYHFQVALLVVVVSTVTAEPAFLKP